MKLFTIGVALCLLWGLRGDNLQQRWSPAPLPKAKRAFVVIAHRGDHTNAPENTLAALKNAIQIGADYVEVDLRTTKDGHIVNLHDATVDRTTDGKGPVAEKTLEEVRALKVRDARWPDRKPERIPTFEDILRIARGRVLLYLDCKEIDPARVVALLRKFRMEQSVVVYDDPAGCAAWKKVAPHIPVMTSPPREARSVSALEQFWRAYPVEILDGSALFYTPELVAAAKQWGTAVWPDIQNPGENSTQWNRALEMGVQGLQTDHPGALIAYLASIGRR
jgi:glycerophosphoryl diester phosphodiesterase